MEAAAQLHPAVKFLAVGLSRFLAASRAPPRPRHTHLQSHQLGLAAATWSTKAESTTKLKAWDPQARGVAYGMAALSATGAHVGVELWCRTGDRPHVLPESLIRAGSCVHVGGLFWDLPRGMKNVEVGSWDQDEGEPLDQWGRGSGRVRGGGGGPGLG